MAVDYQDAVIEQLTTTPGATIYTAPSTVKSSQVQSITCVNGSTSTATYTIHVVQSGESAVDGNIYADARTVAVNGQDTPPGIIGMVLKPSDFITAFASAVSSLQLKIGLKEIT